MTTNEKLPLFSTRMNLQYVKQKLVTAAKGHKLLKSKADALNQQFKIIEEKYKKLNQNTEKLFKETFLSLSKAEFLGANIELFLKDSEKYPVILNSKILSVSGVKLPEYSIETSYDFDETFGRGSVQFSIARKQFKHLIASLVDICTIKNSFFAIKNALETTNRRVNALEHLLIPKLENTMKFISSELDEQEREDFFRLKKVQNMNK